MKKSWSGIRRGAALILALILALLPLAGLADVQSDLSVAVTWGDGGAAWATRVGYEGYADCYWVQVPADMLGGLTLQISDLSTKLVDFFALPEHDLKKVFLLQF